MIALVLVLLVLGMKYFVFAETTKSSLSSTFVLLPGGEGGAGFDDLNFSSNLHKVLVPGGRTGKLYLIDSKTNGISMIDGFSIDSHYPGGHGQSITSADEGRGFILTADRDTLRINMLDLQANAAVVTAPLADTPDYVRFIGPTNEVWVTEPASERIEIFTFLAKPKPALFHSGFIDVPGGPESLIVDHDRRYAYTHLWEGQTIAIDLHTHAIISQWPNGCKGSRGIALDEKRGFLFAGCGEGKAVVLDVKHDGRQLGSITTGSGVDVIGYNPVLSHLYLSAADSATLSVIGVSNKGKLSLLATGNAVKGAHCVTGDDQGNIWVCDPQHGRLLMYKDEF